MAMDFLLASIERIRALIDSQRHNAQYLPELERQLEQLEWQRDTRDGSPQGLELPDNTSVDERRWLFISKAVPDVPKVDPLILTTTTTTSSTSGISCYVDAMSMQADDPVYGGWIRSRMSSYTRLAERQQIEAELSAFLARIGLTDFYDEFRVSTAADGAVAGDKAACIAMRNLLEKTKGQLLVACRT
jgi:hypothetical protein